MSLAGEAALVRSRKASGLDALAAGVGEHVKLEDLLGRRVRFKGERGHIVEGHSGEGASVVVSIRRATARPSRSLTVPEAE